MPGRVQYITKAKIMKTFEFTVTIIGSGETQEEAWQDAVDALADNPGDPETAKEIDDEA